jgi:hypothetical protein
MPTTYQIDIGGRVTQRTESALEGDESRSRPMQRRLRSLTKSVVSRSSAHYSVVGAIWTSNSLHGSRSR